MISREVLVNYLQNLRQLFVPNFPHFDSMLFSNNLVCYALDIHQLHLHLNRTKTQWSQKIFSQKWSHLQITDKMRIIVRKIFISKTEENFQKSMFTQAKQGRARYEYTTTSSYEKNEKDLLMIKKLVSIIIYFRFVYWQIVRAFG